MIIVRSQNKKALKRCNNIQIDKYFGDYNIVDFDAEGVEEGETYLGTYKSEERAIDVLDEIQRHLELLEHNRLYVGSPQEQYGMECVIYKMPEE